MVAPEGDRVIFSYHDFSLKVWDLDANKLERTLRGHTAQINRIVLTSDGSRVVSAADDGTVRVWSISGVSNKSAVRRRANSSHTSRISALAVTPDGEHALSGSVDGVTVWDLRKGVAEQAFAEQDGWVDEIAISPDGQQATVVSSRGYGQFDTIITDASDQHAMKSQWRYTWSGAQTGSVYDVMTGQRIHSAVFGLGDPEAVKRNEAAAVRELNQYGELSTYVPIMMTDTDGSVTEETENTFLTYFTPEGGRARSIPALDSLAHSIYRPTIAVGSGRLIHFERTVDGLLVLQSDFQTPPTRVIFNYTGNIYPRAVTPDGRYLVLALDQGLLRVFDFQTNELTDGFQGHKTAVYQVAFTPNGQSAVSLSEDGTCATWDLHTREAGLDLESHELVKIKAVSADSRRVLLVSPRALVIVFPLGADDKSAFHLLEGHTAEIHDVAVTPDGHRAASVSEDCTIKIWSLDSGQELSSVTLDQPIHKVAFALDGEAIIMGDAVGNIYCLRYMG